MKINYSELSDGEKLEFGQFNVIVGGNSVGKTTLILELFFSCTNRPRNRWHWLKPNKIEWIAKSPQKDLQILMSSMSQHYDGATPYYIPKGVKNFDGSLDLDSNLRFNMKEFEEVEQSIHEISESEVTSISKLTTVHKYRRPFIALESCETRLSLQSGVGINSLRNPPQDARNSLYRNGQLLREIDDKIYEQFGFHFCLLDHSKAAMELGLSKTTHPNVDPITLDRHQEFLQVEEWKNQNVDLLEEVGHGIRSLVKLLLSLLDPLTQIILIDEPEMHLYPSQKRWLGRQLVELSQRQEKQVFVVTHDPMILQGILDSEGTTRIFRIDNDVEKERGIKQCNLDNLTDIGARRNQDSYLQGLFYQRFIAVEGTSERGFYQTMLDELFQSSIKGKY